MLAVKCRVRRRQSVWWAQALTTLAMSLLVLGVGYGVWRGAQWTLDQLVFDNPAFELKYVDVQTDGQLAPEDVARWAGIRPGQNLLAMKLDALKAELELLPAIRAVSVQRILPHTLRLRVFERCSIAQVRLPVCLAGGQGVGFVSYFLDAEGYVRSGQPTTDLYCSATGHLPVLVGVAPKDLRPGRHARSIEVQAALDLIRVFQRSPLASRLELLTLDLTIPGAVKATSSDGSQVLVGIGRASDSPGPDGLIRQLEHWRLVREYGERHGRRILRLDLSVTNYAPVVWAARPVSPTPAATHRPATYSPETRRHV